MMTVILHTKMATFMPAEMSNLLTWSNGTIVAQENCVALPETPHSANLGGGMARVLDLAPRQRQHNIINAEDCSSCLLLSHNMCGRHPTPLQELLLLPLRILTCLCMPTTQHCVTGGKHNATQHWMSAALKLCRCRCPYETPPV